MLVTWGQVIMVGCWLSVGNAMAVNIVGCKQHGANVGCLWLPGRLSFGGCAQQWVCLSVKGLGAAGLTAVSLVVQQT